MIADRVILLPGTRVGTRVIMGSGALGRRNGTYGAGSTWLGNGTFFLSLCDACLSHLPLILDKGEAICLKKGSPEHVTGSDTTTPFGRAYYKKEANFFVLPYTMILAISATTTAFSGVYWSITALGSAQVLRQIQIHLHHFQLFAPSWYRFGILYAIIAMCFAIILPLLSIISVLWDVTVKWVLIGRRKPGLYDWDQSSYCQRWQLQLVLSPFILKDIGMGGILAPFTGSAYIVWYFRALGATIGQNCGLWVGGSPGLMTEPDLVEVISFIFFAAALYLSNFLTVPVDWRRCQLG